MIELYILIICLFLITIASYYMMICIIQLWTGKNKEEAMITLNSAINRKKNHQLYYDESYSAEIWRNVESIIGSNRFVELNQLSYADTTRGLLFTGTHGRLPFVAISVFHIDDNEKIRLENVICNLTIKYLQLYGFDDRPLIIWKRRRDLQMPYLMIKYARYQSEKDILNMEFDKNKIKVTTKNNDVLDDTEEENLND